jgi:hypothetical protein
MHIGITGTRWGMSDRQKEIAIYIYEKFRGNYLHQGMCEGSDTEMHDMVREKFPASGIKGHPSIKKDYEINRVCDRYAEEKGHLERNREIVSEVEVMIATPHQSTEQQRGGTWYTIRYAKKIIKSGKGLCKKLYVIYPDGKVDYFDINNLSD